MIKKLKKKFILLATSSLLLLMTVLLCAINIINFSAVKQNADSILSLFSYSEMSFIFDFLPQGMSPEIPYEARYFTVLVSDKGAIIKADLEKVVSVSSEDLIRYVSKALAKKAERGFTEDYRFAKFESLGYTRIVFLDCGRQLDSFYRFMTISVLIGFGGCILVFVIFLLAANRIVRPIAESYTKQKQFISDAGHEIKTPLTVIAANTDLLEADIGENECISDIREQAKRLTALTNELVSLSRMEESDAVMLKSEFPVSELVSETASSFRALAASQKKNFTMDIADGISMNGSPDAIRQLVSILLDNAFKYSPAGGTVDIKMTSSKKDVVITVSNTTVSQIRKEDTARVFDRFYRTDDSRNSETGGHGIGLSLAKAITDAHGGKITAETQNGADFNVTAVIPL